jgi:ribosomal protein S18 acetylase RimI-like enzyme
MLFNAGVLTKSDLSEINNNSPKVFESFKNQNLLFENGIIDNRPSTIVKVEKSCDDVKSLLDANRDTRGDLIEDVLCGDIGELVDSWSYYYENPTDLVDNLNKENEQRVIDEISRITGYEKLIIEENGIRYYLNGEDEDFDKDSFDNIIRVLASAQNSADNTDYYNYLYKEIENSLEELGEVYSLNDEGVKMTVDLSNHLTMDEISERMDEYEFTDISDLFEELISRGEIDLPNFSIDDRYSAYGSNKDFNSYVSDSDFEQGYKKGGSVGGNIESTKIDDFVELKYIQNGKKLGYLNYYFDTDGTFSPYLNYKNELYIDMVQVKSQYRGKGIAKQLINKAIEDAKKLGIQVVTLKRDVGMGCLYGSEYDTYLKKIYSSIGFVETWTEKESEESGGEKNICAMHYTTFDANNPDIRYELGGEITLTTEQVENKLGRNLHWWNDDVVTINGIEYKKVFLRPEYVKK